MDSCEPLIGFEGLGVLVSINFVSICYYKCSKFEIYLSFCFVCLFNVFFHVKLDLPHGTLYPAPAGPLYL